jgi:hypothetical protein
MLENCFRFVFDILNIVVLTYDTAPLSLQVFSESFFMFLLLVLLLLSLALGASFFLFIKIVKISLLQAVEAHMVARG